MNKKLFYITTISATLAIVYLAMLAVASIEVGTSGAPSMQARLGSSYVDSNNVLHVKITMSDVPYRVYSGVVVDLETYDSTGGAAITHSTTLK